MHPQSPGPAPALPALDLEQSQAELRAAQSEAPYLASAVVPVDIRELRQQRTAAE